MTVVSGPGRPAEAPVARDGEHSLDGASCAGSCDPTPSCVAGLATPAERLAATCRAIAREREPLVTLTHLLHLCRDEHPALRAGLADPVSADRVGGLRAELAAVLPAAGTADRIAPGVAATLAAALEPLDGIPAVVVARALAELIDDRYGPTFTASFSRRSPYPPGVGDPVPLDSPDLREVTDLSPTSPPWRLANRLDETRRVRLAGEWAAQFRVVFDYSLSGALAGLVAADTVVATIHPNAALEEFRLPEDGRERSFPVQPRDVDGQRRRIDALISTAVDRGASIVVLPELSVTEALARDLEDWVRRPGSLRLLVAGSYHHELPDADTPVRRNTALAWVRGADHPLTQDKHSPADRPVVEDLTPEGWPELRVHVTADGWHVVLAICRDLLNPRAVEALTEAGANLVLVPAMSETLVPFGSPVAHLVGDDQALVVVANNPAQWSRDAQPVAPRPARALVGHPGFGQLTRSVATTEAVPGVALLRIRSGELKWVPVAVPDPVDGTGAHPGLAEPSWTRSLSEYTRRWSGASRPGTTVTLRTAAVLVLVLERPDGPHVVLTKRTSDLADYPGELVFPGGAAEEGDAGPVGTALREAREETGLDTAGVHVIGVLPSYALLDSHFLVTPVLAWSATPSFPDSTNLAEVESILEVPLAGPPRREGTASEASPYGRMTEAVLDLVAGLLSGGTGMPGPAADRIRWNSGAPLSTAAATPGR